MNIRLLSLALLTCSSSLMAEPNSVQQVPDEQFNKSMMTAKPFVPAGTSREVLVGLPNYALSDLKKQGFQDIAYKKDNWTKQIKWQPINVNETLGKALVIELAKHQDTIHYRYSANGQSFSPVIEPWSTSKIMPITAAMISAAKEGINSDFLVGQYAFSDLITSIHSYDENGVANGNSNAIATYLANQVGRQKLTNMFHVDWLKLGQKNIFFKGAYAREALTPTPNKWLGDKTSVIPNGVANASDDPDYVSYRCDTCNLTGNKPMSTLALAEWLKRLVVNQHDLESAIPELADFDMSLLFYGSHHAKQPEGMMAGVSKILANAVATNITPLSVEQMLATDKAKTILDAATKGQWRLFQKIGWGYSGTRTAGEMVYLAHVSLPNYKGGKEFTLAAQTSVPGNDEANLYKAGKQMQNLLNQVIKDVLQSHD